MPQLGFQKWMLTISQFGSAKTDPVRFKWGFGEVLLKDKFAFKSLIKVLYLRGENYLQNAHFYKQKGPCLKAPLNWTGSVFPLLTNSHGRGILKRRRRRGADLGSCYGLSRGSAKARRQKQV